MFTVRRAVAAALALVLAPGTGCSWIFVNKPPPEPVSPTPPVVCTSSVASPVIDTVLMALAMGGGLALIVDSSKPVPPCTGGWCFQGFGNTMTSAGIGVGAVLIASTFPLGLSAWYGYSKTSDCRELKDAQLACVSGVEGSCKRLEAGPAVPPVSPNLGASCSRPENCKGGSECKLNYDGQGICVEAAPKK